LFFAVKGKLSSPVTTSFSLKGEKDGKGFASNVI
jgi:hypothetical protein